VNRRTPSTSKCLYAVLFYIDALMHAAHALPMAEVVRPTAACHPAVLKPKTSNLLKKAARLIDKVKMLFRIRVSDGTNISHKRLLELDLSKTTIEMR
jgi:hypothetical protein